MKGKFKIGDRVRIIECSKAGGKLGIIKCVESGDYGVEFDLFINGHNCSGHCKDGHGWWVSADCMELVNDKTENIVIYCKDNEVVALDKSTGEKGIAKCSPYDEFDFMTGAKLAFERLHENLIKRKPHLKSCKILDGKYYGEIGKPTKLKDIVGRALFVGDVVELFDDDDFAFGESSIVENEGKQYVMGIRNACNEDGKITRGWKVIKKRSYTEVADGEVIDKTIKYVGHCND